MTRVIRRAPIREDRHFPSDADYTSDYGIPALIPYAWVALGFGDVIAPNEWMPVFPVVIDTGYNGTLAIREEALKKLIGTSTNWMDQFSEDRQTPEIHTGSRGQYYACDLALFLLRSKVDLNDPISLLPDRTSFIRLDFDEGLQVYVPPKSNKIAGEKPVDNRPTAPLLGMRAIRDAGLKLVTNGHSYSLGTDWMMHLRQRFLDR